ncbi:MAG: hypothetical protein GY928_19430, partial [Colwellia sp.]|nr:hypothetical protein [Colwellia sp.]
AAVVTVYSYGLAGGESALLGIGKVGSIARAGYFGYLASQAGKRKEHFESHARTFSTLPDNFQDFVNKGGLEYFEDFGFTPTHNLRTRGNRDFRNPDTGDQFIFNLEGALVVDVLNGGSFDIVSPKTSYLGHFRKDVLPYLRWGNAVDDPSTRRERLWAFVNTLAYGIYRKTLTEKTLERQKQEWIATVSP